MPPACVPGLQKVPDQGLGFGLTGGAGLGTRSGTLTTTLLWSEGTGLDGGGGGVAGWFGVLLMVMDSPRRHLGWLKAGFGAVLIGAIVEHLKWTVFACNFERRHLHGKWAKLAEISRLCGCGGESSPRFVQRSKQGIGEARLSLIRDACLFE